MTATVVQPASIPTPEGTDARLTLFALGLFALLSFTCAILMPGFVAADACTHYLFAKYAFADPVNLVDVWGRPLCTLLYAVPAHFGGRLGVRACAILVAIACALVAQSIARTQGIRRPALALLFTLGGPLFFLFSFAEMTELPFALVLGGAFLAYQKRRWMSFALLTGLLPAARPEGFGFILLGLAALLLHRRWLAIPILILPLLTWDVAGWLITARPCPWYLWLIRAWPWSEQSLYGRGSIFTFAAAVPLIVPPLVLPATLAGIGLSCPRPGTLRSAIHDHNARCRFLVAAIPVMVLVVHSLLRAMGKFGSFGEARYLLIAAPLWGVCSARGWEYLTDRLRFRHPNRLALAAVCLPFLINVFYPLASVHLEADWLAAAHFAKAYRESPELRRDYPRIIAAHPGIHYFLDLDPGSNGHRNAPTTALIAQAPPGCILIWDPVYSPRNAAADQATTIAQIVAAGWQPRPEFDNLPNNLGPTDRPVFKIFTSPRASTLITQP